MTLGCRRRWTPVCLAPRHEAMMGERQRFKWNASGMEVSAPQCGYWLRSRCAARIHTDQRGITAVSEISRTLITFVERDEAPRHYHQAVRRQIIQTRRWSSSFTREKGKTHRFSGWKREVFHLPGWIYPGRLPGEMVPSVSVHLILGK